MFVHASPDAGAVDISLNDRKELTSVNYPTNSTWRSIPFISEANGGYDVSVSPAGTTTDVARIATTFNRDTSTVAVVDGLVTPDPSDPQKSLDITTFTVNRIRPNGNKARLIIFHGFQRAAGLSTPAVLFRNPGENPLFTTGNVNPGTQTTLDIDSGTFTWNVRRADGEAIYVSATHTAAPGSVLLVLISGVENDPTNPAAIRFIDLQATD
jgi:hypothetical protein